VLIVRLARLEDGNGAALNTANSTADVVKLFSEKSSSILQNLRSRMLECENQLEDQVSLIAEELQLRQNKVEAEARILTQSTSFIFKPRPSLVVQWDINETY
jgi:hypothetical protein